MTSEGRRRLALAMKRRWAAKRTGAQAKQATTKKSRTERGGPSKTGRSDEAPLGREAHGLSDKEKSGLIRPASETSGTNKPGRPEDRQP
jgi:hypothetical protein